MQILLYDRLNTEPVQRQFEKTLRYLEQGDFRSADVRKMKTRGYYRARLDDTNRLLFQIGEYEDKKYIFVLEVILNHAYDKSRFLRGAIVQDEKLKPLHDVQAIDDDGVMDLDYLNPNSSRFSIVGKIITFDESQSEILLHQPPMLLLGAAGSGKTVLALEKIRSMEGKVLYVTLSAYLAGKAKACYEQHEETIEGQTVLFSSLDAYLRQVLCPKGEEATYTHFKVWFERIRSTVRIRDAHKLFEEIRGVITGTADDKPYLTKEEYQKLGIRQSVFSNADKEQVYAIFQRYLTWLKTEDLYDPNIAAQAAQALVQPIFDLVVVDEVQDMTNVQLSLILKSLKNKTQFIICGDANQVVHPNFFSWTSVKRLLHQRGLSRDIVRLLPSNHRNDEHIVKFTNRLLALKHVRFGSIDKESSMVDMQAHLEGDKSAVKCFEATPEVLEKIKKGAASSSHIAVIVLRESDKEAAKQQFDTPMIFTVHEAKGLEFMFVILYNFLSDSSEQFEGVCEGVMPRDLNGTLQYSRPKDKEDRSLQAYLFYINALYVAMTRAVSLLYIVERQPKQRLLNLLGVRSLYKTLDRMPSFYFGIGDWEQEAKRLESFGRLEQAQAIRAKFGRKYMTPPWEVTTFREYHRLRNKYYIDHHSDAKNQCFNVREKNKLYEHVLFYTDLMGYYTLTAIDYKRAKRIKTDKLEFMSKLLAPYKNDNPQRIESLVKKYGPDFRNELGLTPLMLAAFAGAVNIAKYLVQMGANLLLVDNRNMHCTLIVSHLRPL